MTDDQQEPRPTMEEPANYRIRVRGSVDARWSERLGGMRVSTSRAADGEVETVLSGRLADQAALAGVLNTVYELHLPVVSVECIGADDEPVEGIDTNNE